MKKQLLLLVIGLLLCCSNVLANNVDARKAFQVASNFSSN